MRTWQDQLHDDSYSTLTDIDQLSQMLIQESNIKKEIDTSYEAVSAESKQLLEALQKPLLAGDERDSPEFSEAASHVMELFLNVHEHHRQLGILWDAKQSGLRELIHMLTLDQDITQVGILEYLVSSSKRVIKVCVSVCVIKVCACDQSVIFKTKEIGS